MQSIHKEGGKLFIEIIKLDKLQGSILIYWENEFLKSSLLKSEDYNFKNDYMYKFNGETKSEPNEIEKHVKFVNHIFESIRPLKPGEIPQEHGFCFEDSILIDEPKAQVNERVIATGIWADHPDVHFTFATLTNTKAMDPPLLERLKRSRHSWGSKVVRSRRRDLASGEVGEEHLERVRDHNGVWRHLFIWEAEGKPMYQSEHPQIRLDMSTGNGREGPEDSSLSDEEALRVWDIMVNSIRLRPVEQAK